MASLITTSVLSRREHFIVLAKYSYLPLVDCTYIEVGVKISCNK